jgi:phosphate transport system permease protein
VSALAVTSGTGDAGGPRSTRGARGPLARRVNLGDGTLIGLTTLATVIVLAMLLIVVGDVIVGGWGVISWEFISAAPRDGMTKGGIFPAIFGTVALTLLMTIVAVPAGVATAVYLTEYAPASSPVARVIRVCIANLAGVPSIVFGLFGLGFFVATVGRSIDVAAYGGQPTYGKPSLIWAALTLAILTLPVVVVATEEALRAVPRELRDGSLALGATKGQTIARVVLPQALGGILTGAILAVSRGAGEVAPIMFTGAAYFLPYLPTHLNDQFMNLGYHVYVLATQSPDVDRTKPLLYGTVLVLLLLTFLLNIVAIAIRIRFRRRMTGGR